MYDTLEAALEALGEAEEDVAADQGPEAVDAAYGDIVHAVAWDVAPKIKAEFFRVTGVDAR